MPSRDRVDRVVEAIRARAKSGQLFLFCFGASVTGQSRENSFVDRLPEALAAQVPGIRFRLDRLAFGGSSLNDAGFFHVDRVIAAKPDICILDWHSTQLDRFDGRRYAYVLTALLDAGILPVQLAVPRMDCLDFDRPNVLQARQVQEASGLPVIDLRDFLDRSADGLAPLVRDMVHTTPEGGRLYARLIAGELRRILAPPAVWPAGPPCEAPAEAPSVFAWGGHPVAVGEASELLVELQASGDAPFDLHAEVLVGPFSPVVAVGLACAEETRALGEICIWDADCHYMRVAHKILIEACPPPCRGPFTVRVTLTGKAPDYSTCRRPGFGFDGARMFPVRRLMSAGARILVARVVQPLAA